MIINVPQHQPLSDFHCWALKTWVLSAAASHTGNRMDPWEDPGKRFTRGYFLNNQLNHWDIHVLNSHLTALHTHQGKGKGCLEFSLLLLENWGTIITGDEDPEVFLPPLAAQAKHRSCPHGILCAVTLAVFTQPGNASSLAQSLLLYVSK